MIIIIVITIAMTITIASTMFYNGHLHGVTDDCTAVAIASPAVARAVAAADRSFQA